jgi:hypothetical protein
MAWVRQGFSPSSRIHRPPKPLASSVRRKPLHSRIALCLDAVTRKRASVVDGYFYLSTALDGGARIEPNPEHPSAFSTITKSIPLRLHS